MPFDQEEDTALTDTKLRNLKLNIKAYQVADDGGLFVFIQPSGHKSWKLRYRMGGRTAKQEKVVLGDYQAYSLTEARTWQGVAIRYETR